MREIVIAGNWKMNTNPWEGAMLARDIAGLLTGGNGLSQVTVVVCPPATHLVMVVTTLSGSSVMVGAQNVHWDEKGAFTGEISADWVHFLGARWTIIGHSERRRWFGETDATVNGRLKRAIASGLRPIVCVGETLEEREAGKTFEVIERQIRVGLKEVALTGRGGIVIAYEPVWAIGTGRNATPAQAQEAHSFIRDLLGRLYHPDLAEATVIQYGGSVTAENAPALMPCPDVDGALVGGASLKLDQFMAIIHAAAAAKAAAR